MDANKKVAAEKRIIIGLTMVFMVTFVTGPLKSLGIFGRPAHPIVASPVQAVTMSKPLGAMVQDQQRKIEMETALASSAARDRFMGPVRYKAQDLRDPLQSLLPEPEPQKAQGGYKDRVAQAGPPSPPVLHVQGLLWGGSKPKAIIDGEVYDVGDVVKGAKIVAIVQGGVTVEHEGKSLFYAPPKAPAQSGYALSRQAEWR